MFNTPIFFVAFSYNFCLFFSPPQKKSRSIGSFPSFSPPTTDDETSKSSSIVSSLIESSDGIRLISLRVLGNTFVIVSEKVICFALGVDVVKPIASATRSLPPSNKNLCVSDNVDGVEGGVGGNNGNLPLLLSLLSLS